MIHAPRPWRSRQADDNWTTDVSLQDLLAAQPRRRWWRRRPAADAWTSDAASPEFYLALLREAETDSPREWSSDPGIAGSLDWMTRPRHDPVRFARPAWNQLSPAIGAATVLAAVGGLIAVGVFFDSIGGSLALQTSEESGPYTISIAQSAGGSNVTDTPTADPTGGHHTLGATRDDDGSETPDDPSASPTDDASGTPTPSGGSATVSATGTTGDGTPGGTGTASGTPTPPDGSATPSETPADGSVSPTESPTPAGPPEPSWWPDDRAWPPSWYVAGDPMSELMLGLMSGQGFGGRGGSPTVTVTPTPTSTATPEPTPTVTPTPAAVPSPEWWPAQVAWPPAWLPADSLAKLSALSLDDLVADGAYGYYLAPGASVTATFFEGCDATVVTITPPSGTPTPPTVTGSVTPTPLADATPGCTPGATPAGSFSVNLTWVPYVGWVPVLNPSLFPTPTATDTPTATGTPTPPTGSPTADGAGDGGDTGGSPTETSATPSETPSATATGSSTPSATPDDVPSGDEGEGDAPDLDS